MYRLLIRPLLFLVYPEKVHHWMVELLKIAYGIRPLRNVITYIYKSSFPSLHTHIFGLHFKNPVGLAAGFDKDADFFREFAMLGFGFIEIGTLTPKGQAGNPKPRSFRLPGDKALINRMGFNNLGVDEAVEKLKDRPNRLIIGGNIGKNTLTPPDKVVEDYEYCFLKLYNYIDYFVVNVSCPNIGDISKLQDQETLEAILGRLADQRKAQSVYRPILLKISPDLNFRQIDETLLIVQKHGIDGIVAVNTTITRSGLQTSEDRIKAIGNGGLSGAPLKNRSNEIIRYIKSKAPGLPIIGSGGIMSPADAQEKLDAGADLLQVYTGFIYEGPGFVKDICKYLEEERRKQGGSGFSAKNKHIS
jgi:dihydroorotate dehydrogenase